MKKPGLLCVVFMLSLSLLHAQDLENEYSDLSQINVEEITDSQLREVIQRAEQSGMTETQMKSALLARGLPATELRKLEERLVSLETEMSSLDVVDRSREEMRTVQRKDVFGSLLKSDSEEELEPETRIFGYDLFRNEQLTFEPSMNIPTPPDYQVGSGDELIVDIWGASQQNYQLPVSPDGKVFIENLGPIQVSGLTVEEASNRIMDRLVSIYSGLKGPDRNTYAQVTLGSTRTISVHILGEVQLPGTFTLSAFATTFNALYAAGGPSESGSFRNIELFRNNQKVADLDIYDFLVYGKQENNIRLQDQDVIKVNPYDTRVDLTGKMKRPGRYELTGNETFADLLNYSGGFTDEAYQKMLTVYRKTDTEQRIVNLSKDMFSDFVMRDGDSIPVAPVLDRFENRVILNGAVFRPGEYALTEGLTLSALIERAEGLREDAFLQRALIYRTRDDFSVEVIPVNLETLNDAGQSGIRLYKNDIVSVSSIFDLRESYYVEISGEVNEPGVYPFMESTSLEDLIMMAGGLSESASLSRVEVARRYRSVEEADMTGILSEIYQFTVDKDLGLSDDAEQFSLQPFDQVFIRKSPGYEEPQVISVEGEVAYPGEYSLSNKLERISDIVNRAGGLTAEAYPEGASLIRKVSVDQEERRKALESLMEESGDSLVFNVDEETEQAIGIDLTKILENPGSKYDIFLQDGDQLKITKEAQTVRLSGALLYPITVRYDKSYSFSRYISMAGGFASDAKKSKSYVIYANGSIDKTNNFLFFRNYPKVAPGAEIVVPRKPERTKMSTQEVVGLSSAVSSMALIIVTIINNFDGGSGQ